MSLPSIGCTKMRNDDPYLYKNTDTLINKLNIKNAEILEQYEADSVAGLMLSLRMSGLIIESVFDIQKIHKKIFGHIFEWAGEFRTITMYKKEQILNGFSVDYTPAGYIEDEMQQLDKKFKSIPWDVLTDFEKVLFISDITQELWQIHCFREGNSRSVGLFLYFLLKQNGFNLNTKFLGDNSIYFRNSLVLASIGYRSKKEYLRGLIMDCVSYKEPNTNKYKSIGGIEYEKYVSLPHTIEKLKTIKSLKDIQD